MLDGRLVDLTSELEMKCLWFGFSKLLQNVLNEVKEHWITHRIRKSRHDTVSSRPDSLYYLPELHGVGDQFLLAMLAHMSLKTIRTMINRNISIMSHVLVVLGNQLIGQKHQSSSKLSCSLPIIEACYQHRGNYFGGNLRKSPFQRLLHHRE